MSFYQSIAPWYDLIFPVQPAAENRLLTLAGPAPADILDIACGTGGYAGSLAGAGHRVLACDLDPEMVYQAACRPGVRAFQADMTQLAQDLPSDAPVFDLVYCVGNSLVHLPSETEVLSALRQMAERLRPGGRCLLQIINYGRVISQNLKGLPEITRDEPGLVFQRQYRKRADGRLDFITSLSVTENQQPIVMRHSVPLLPLQPETLSTLLRTAGFEQFQLAGSFAGAPFDLMTSQPLIVTAIRPA